MDEPDDLDRVELTARSACASHRLVGSIYWDPGPNWMPAARSRVTDRQATGRAR